MRKPLKSNDKIKLNLNLYKKEENKITNLSRSNSKKLSSSRIVINQKKSRNDKVEKKLYLENINMKSHINSDLLSKLTSTFRSFNFQSGMNDPKIVSNLFNIGSKRSLLLRRSVNKVRNMIQDFDNQFSIKYDFNSEKQNNNNICNKYNYETKQIKEKSYSDFDFNLNKTNETNTDVMNNKSLTNKKNFFKEMKKGEKYLNEEQIIETELKNEKKIMGLKNAFKYYELLYKYKYFLTEKDILCLSFNRRKEMEKKELSKYIKQSKIKLENHKEKCEKCEANKKNNKFKYKNNLNIHLFHKNFSDSNINNNSNSKKNLKKAFSGISNSIISNSNKNYFINNSNSKYSKAITRPTTASPNNFQKFNNQMNYNSLNSAKKSNSNLNLSEISSKNLEINPFPKKKSEIKSDKSNKNLSIKNKIKNISENILTTGDRIKNNLEETYQNIMEKIEEEKKQVKKVKKKMKINIDKIRTDLNLKYTGEGIDENKMIMDNVDKLYKTLPKTHVNLMRSIAKIVIEEDRRKNKPSIYNYTYDNKLFKKKHKKEMFEASCKMKEIRKSLNKNKREKPFEETLRHLLKNDYFIFFSIKSLKEEIDKIRVFRGEIIKN